MKPLTPKELEEIDETRQKLNDTALTQEEITKKMISTIDKANTASVLMAQLCKAMDLEPSKTTHQQFVDTFSNLQKTRLAYEQDLQEMFVSTQTVKEKIKRPRKTAVEKELEAWEEFPEKEIEKTDTFQNGDYK